jgi:DNA-binding PadR family transcriptional regulator
MMNVLRTQKDVVNEIYGRFLREFMDLFIMVKMREAKSSGYDIMTHFHHRYDLLVSPGTVYSVLYSLEREGLIKADDMGGKRIYSLTGKGEAIVKTISESGKVLEGLFSNLLRNSRLPHSETLQENCTV